MRCLQDTARVVLALWLALAPVKAWAGNPMLLGAGKAGAGVTAPSYTFINVASSTSSGSNISTSMNLGGNASCLVVVAVIAQKNNATLTMAVGGTSLNPDIKNTPASVSFTTALFSGALAGNCSGSQAVALTTDVSSFTLRGLAIWVVQNNASNIVVQTSGYTIAGSTKSPASPTINVTAGDLMFGASYMSSNGVTCASSSVAPAAVHSINGATSNAGIDWSIAGSNVSFALNCDGTGSSDGSASFATYH